MRFICLHGAGTNSRLFELQTIALRYELGGDHIFEFVEGIVHCPVFRGIENLTSNQDEFFAYYEPYSADSFRKAVNDLQDYISAEGPFDAIIAFSQGASLAAALLLEMQLDAAMSENPRPKPVSCAIFFAGRLPYVDAASGQTVDSRHTVAEDAVIDMPTAHIWGANDDLEPGQPQALAKICKSEDMFTFIHEGGHDIPGAGNDEAVTGTIRAIRRALDQIDS